MRRREPRPEPEPVAIGQGTARNETAKAIRINLASGRQLWIPKSVIHANSEVFDMGEHSTGEVVVMDWFAEKEGLA